tara:strand:+ start:2292 stop:2615 length:324 start_codon:yes stop_codon:yes gene_type:complete
VTNFITRPPVRRNKILWKARQLELIKNRSFLFNSLEFPASLNRSSCKAGGFLSFCFKTKEKNKMQSGIYFVRLKENGKIIQTEKVALLNRQDSSYLFRYNGAIKFML